MSRENELKFRIPDEAAYRAVGERLGVCAETVEQVNVYLDTPDDQVERRRSALRLRREGSSRFLTYKRGIQTEGGYFEAMEFEVPIDEEQFAALAAGGWLDLPPLEELAADVGGRPGLKVVGKVENLRRRYPLVNGEVAELDRTVFPGGRVDFELEVETEAPEQVRKLLAGLGLDLPVQTHTKYRRFLEAIGRVSP